MGAPGAYTPKTPVPGPGRLQKAQEGGHGPDGAAERAHNLLDGCKRFAYGLDEGNLPFCLLHSRLYG